MYFMDSVELLQLLDWISEYWMADKKLGVVQMEQTSNDSSGSGQQKSIYSG